MSQAPMQQGLGAYFGMTAPPEPTVSLAQFNELKAMVEALQQRLDELTKDKS